MKTFRFKKQSIDALCIVFISFVLSGCSPTIFYQLYNLKTDEPSYSQNQYILDYEDVSLKYNFWTENGQSDFLFTNKTNRDVYVDLTSTHLVLNGYANTYFQNLYITTTKSTSASATYYPIYTSSAVALTSGSGSSIMKAPESVIAIPANSSKTINGFHLNSSLIYDCDHDLFPNKKRIKTQAFTIDNSPLTIRNIICYSYDRSLDSLISVENEFYVSSITNYPKSEIIVKRNLEYCGNRSAILQDYFLKSSPKMFYIEYTPADTPWK